MLWVGLALIGFASLFYFLAYISPRTDMVFYGVAGVILIIGGVFGFLGYADIEIGNEFTYTKVTNGNTVSYDMEYNPTYSNNNIFTLYIPMVEFLVGLYILIATALNFSKARSSLTFTSLLMSTTI